jgi:hypothetical protein
MNKVQIKNIKENCIRNGGGIYDTRNYRYVLGDDGILKRIRLNKLDTTAVYEEGAWETVAHLEEREEIVPTISGINIKSETFCTPWNGHLYCVDIMEDAEERSAWLYRSGMGVKSFMFGYMLKDMDADKFKDLVFSNLPDYIEDYEEEYGA